MLCGLRPLVIQRDNGTHEADNEKELPGDSTHANRLTLKTPLVIFCYEGPASSCQFAASDWTQIKQ